MDGCGRFTFERASGKTQVSFVLDRFGLGTALPGEVALLNGFVLYRPSTEKIPRAGENLLLRLDAPVAQVAHLE